MGFGVRCCGVDAYVCRRRHSCRRRGDQKSPLRAGGPRHNPGLLARQSVTFRNSYLRNDANVQLGT